jgi:hypothetical protein
LGKHHDAPSIPDHLDKLVAVECRAINSNDRPHWDQIGHMMVNILIQGYRRAFDAVL